LELQRLLIDEALAGTEGDAGVATAAGLFTETLAGLWADRAPSPGRIAICFSLGGREDHLVDRDRHRFADVFPTPEAVVAAGFVDQSDDDRICVTSSNPRVGIPANNIARYRARQGEGTFGSLERDRRARRAGV
jgi:hypothetical protein